MIADTSRADTSRADTTSSEFFEALYRGRDDPWSFSSDPYERRRYGSILDHVDPQRHRRVFEPGCSVGVLTELLAQRCDVVDATDIASTAVERAQRRCRAHPNAHITVGGIVPVAGATYDLVVFSEVGYYLTACELDVAVSELTDAVEPGGRVVAAHWLGVSPDHLRHGREVHDHLTRLLRSWTHVHHAVHPDERRDGFVLDVWDRP